LNESNNRNYSPINGYYYLKRNFVSNKTFVYFVSESQKLEFDKISNDFENAQILQDSFKIREFEKDFYLFEKNNTIISLRINNYILNSITSASKVSKGDYVFSNNDFENGCNTHPHSSHLQILSELGLFGYVFVFAFFIYLIFIFSKNFLNIIFKREKNAQQNLHLYKIFISLALIQHLFPIIPSGNIFNNWLSIFFYFELAFLLNFHYYNKKS
jgi:hypothetical protein